jgi:hypothetical protein
MVYMLRFNLIIPALISGGFIMKLSLLFVVVMAVVFQLGPVWAEENIEKSPSFNVNAPIFNFDPAVEGTKVTHEYIIKNEGEASLDIKNVKTG